MAAPEFFTLDINTLLAENIATYENITGRVLQPAQAERLLINAFTEIQYRYILKAQAALEQMLVEFSSAPALDALGKLVGVTRLSAQSSSCTVQFTLVSGHGGVVIPSGTRVHTADRKYIFVTSTEAIVNAGTNTADILCFSEDPGSAANGYTAGQINILLDPLPSVQSVSNTTESAGGGC